MYPKCTGSENWDLSPVKLHPSSFVRMGLEIEDQQLQVIEHLRSNRQRTDPQKIEIQQRRNVLARRIKAWRVAQAVYMPQAVAYLPDEDSSPTSDDTQGSDVSKPETWPLLLPSAIPRDDRSLCYKGVIETEVLLRSAQLQDNLADLRQSRRALRNLKLYFKTNVAGEGIRTQTKTRAIETSTTSRINRAIRRYRTAYDALLGLDPSGDWRREFRELRNEDNRGPLKEVGELGVGDGRYAPSWIWTIPSATALPGEGSDAERREVDETVRREWMTCRARADRWVEEKELLQEEMRRVIAYLEWKSCVWAKKVGVRHGSCTTDIQRGADSYARKQAYIHHELAVSFVSRWFPYFNACNLKLGWTKDFPWASQIPPYWEKLPKWFPAPSRDADCDNIAKKDHSECFDSDNHEDSGDEESDGGSDDEGWNGEDSDWEGDDGGNESDDGLGFEYDDEYMS